MNEKMREIKEKLMRDNVNVIYELEYWRKIFQDEQLHEIAIEMITRLNRTYNRNAELIIRMQNEN